MAAKTDQLQIRVTREQKSALRRLARRAGMDLSSYVLARALPPATDRWRQLLERLADPEERSYALAAINDLLASLGATELATTVAATDLSGLSPDLRNHLAAMVEHVAHRHGIEPPGWTREVEPSDTPRFATPLRNLRLYLLRSTPVAFKRRNIFVDATVGERV